MSVRETGLKHEPKGRQRVSRCRDDVRGAHTHTHTHTHTPRTHVLRHPTHIEAVGENGCDLDTQRRRGDDGQCLCGHRACDLARSARQMDVRGLVVEQDKREQNSAHFSTSFCRRASSVGRQGLRASVCSSPSTAIRCATHSIAFSRTSWSVDGPQKIVTAVS
jgi:hypothetical protein